MEITDITEIEVSPAPSTETGPTVETRKSFGQWPRQS